MSFKVNVDLNNPKLCPKKEDIFKALEIVPLNRVKVVILGQDPYSRPGQANGLAFSVNRGQKIPPSLKNIFKELKNDIGIEIPTHGDLTAWAKQGVLLLNTILTTEEGKTLAHKGLGWEEYTNSVIKRIADENDHVIFVCWGNKALNKIDLMNPVKHTILGASHPSPLSSKGFFGCRHFSKINDILKTIGKEPIDWSLD